MSKKTIIKGTLILTITGILTKCLGFYNRIFLTRLIGVKELGTYQLIFPLYILGISFCCQGVATTVTKHVSYLRGRADSTDPRQILHIGWAFAVTASLAFSWVLWRFCGLISARVLQNTDCAILLKTLAPALPFVAVKACINAYFIGYSKPIYTGTCQLAEQIVRIGSVYLLASLRLQGVIGAQTAVLGVVIGEIAATVYAICAYRLFRRGKKQPAPIISGETASRKKLRTTADAMWIDILPITGSNLILTLFSSYEAIILPGYLYRFFGDGDRSMELYGVVSGIVIPFLLFPATITGSLSTMLLPSVSYACAEKNPAAIKKALRYSALFCVTLGIFSWIFYLLFGNCLCRIAFQNEEAGELLRRMAFLCPLIYLSGTLSGTLNGMGYASSNLLYSILGISVRITCILFLVPRIGINGYILGMAGGYTLQNLAALIRSLSASSHKACSGTHSSSASSHTAYSHGSART